MGFRRITRIAALTMLLVLLAAVDRTQAQDAEQQNAAPDRSAVESYVPMTTVAPAIPVDQLRVLVKPLTRAELQAEADAWFELLRAKARQLAAVQIGVKKANEALAATSPGSAEAAIDQARAIEAKARREAEETRQQITGEAQSNLGADLAAAPPEDAAGQDAPDASAEPSSDGATDPAALKERLLADQTLLQEQRTALVDRLEAVLESYTAKGGDASEYEQYILAVSGIELDAQDASATWAAVSGWLQSAEGGRRWGWNMLKFFVILLVVWIVGALVARAVNWLLETRLKLSQLAEGLISRTIKNLIYIVGLAVALTALEIDITPILAAIGAAGFIVGFALQGTLSNFASGLMILINRPFDVGNVVTAGGVTGTIHRMNLVSTTFRTFDNQTIHVPNNSIWGSVITNITANETRRVDMEFGVGYDDDFLEAERIIRDAAAEHPLVLKEPAVEVITHALADSSVNIVCRPWAKTSDWWRVKTEVTRTVKQRLDQAGISIPFPQRDVHVYHRGGPGDSTTVRPGGP